MEVLQLLRGIKLKLNYNRKNVSDGGAYTQTMGLVHRRFHTGISLSKLSMDYPLEYEALKNFVKAHDPEFNFTTIMINKNLQCRPHVDRMNVGYSYIIGLGNYTGGELRIYDKAGGYKDHDIKDKWLKFDGSYLHETLPFSGERWTLVYFVHRATQ